MVSLQSVVVRHLSPPKKKTNPSDAGGGAVGVLAGCVLFCVVFLVSVFSDVSAQSG